MGWKFETLSILPGAVAAGGLIALGLHMREPHQQHRATHVPLAALMVHATQDSDGYIVFYKALGGKPGPLLPDDVVCAAHYNQMTGKSYFVLNAAKAKSGNLDYCGQSDDMSSPFLPTAAVEDQVDALSNLERKAIFSAVSRKTEPERAYQLLRNVFNR